MRDYDVEIAQASNIANPDVATIMDGVILDVKVIDAGFDEDVDRAHTSWTRSPSSPGRRLRNRDEVLAWYASVEDTLPDFPEAPEARAARRGQGRVIGAPVTR